MLPIEKEMEKKVIWHRTEKIKKKKKEKIGRSLGLLLQFLKPESLSVESFFPSAKTVVVVAACIYVYTCVYKLVHICVL